MSEQSPYEQLGVSEDATFEEVQAAKQRVIAQLSGDRQLQENIEAAYDAILMDRLKLRQQGKLAVPDGIRYPEKLAPAAPKFPTLTVPDASGWWGDTFETPDRNQILTTSGVYGVLGGASLIPSVASASLPTLVALGTGFSLYFVNQKQRRFKRALVGSLFALVLGTLIAGLVVNYAHLPVEKIGLHGEVFAGLLIFLLLWIVSSFTK